MVVLALVPPPSMPVFTGAQVSDTQTYEGRVVSVIDTRQEEIAPGQVQPVQRLLVTFSEGPLRGQQIEVEHGQFTYTNEASLYRAGDTVLVMTTVRPDGSRMSMVTGYMRTQDLLVLLIVFVGFAVLVSGWKGLRALLGLAISFVVLLGFVLPQILGGRDPVVISVIGSFTLLAVTLYLAQGWTLKAHAALLGIFASLLVAGLLVTWSVDLVRLGGYGSEEAMLLQASGSSVSLRGLLMAGMMVGALGVLDDVIVGQTSAVNELADADPSVSWRELYRRAMNVGHDHIAATVNTLVLAYVGASMPLLLLFRVYPEPWLQTVNRDLVAEEVVRSLVGSISLIAAVPITTLIASLLYGTRRAVPGRRAPATIRVVYDDNALDQRLKPAHGFACLLEAGGKHILFDTGADGPTLVYNLVAMGANPRDIDAVVLSHEQADHTGGMEALLNLNSQLTVFLPSSFNPGVKSAWRKRSRVMEVAETATVAEGIYTFVIGDDASAEQALILKTAHGLVLVTGCAHTGIAAVVRQAQQWGCVHTVVGDFQLEAAPDGEIESTVAALGQLDIAQVAPAHGTGDKAQWRLRAAYGDGYVLTGVGTVITFADPAQDQQAGSRTGEIDATAQGDQVIGAVNRQEQGE